MRRMLSHVLLVLLLMPAAALAATEQEYREHVLAELKSLEVYPAALQLTHKYDYEQLLLTATLSSGQRVDVTRMVRVEPGPAAELIDLSTAGFVRPLREGSGELVFTLGSQRVTVPVQISGQSDPIQPDYIRDVNPVLAKLGCNAGTCHGSKKGKNGFKLSLRGYDPLYDIRALTDDVAARRFNRAAPEQSLMLLKPTGAVPHEGGVVMRPGEPYYEILRSWIADGVTFDPSSTKVTKIDVFPASAVIPLPGMAQQMKVIATYGDGSTRDVTGESFIEPSSIEVLSIDESGLVTALRRGEAAALARYEGAYAATPIVVMGDRSGYQWNNPPAYNYIDELVYAKQRRVKVLPSPVCTDAEFLRRIYLDLTGLPPTPDVVREFLADPRPQRVKREEIIDELIGSEEFIEKWTLKWADMLQVNPKFLGDEGAKKFYAWIRDAVEQNRPYNELAYEVLTASGSNMDNPPASYYKVLRTPEEVMENTTQLFLAIRFNCNKCHDHPFERWTQDQYYEMAAFFAQINRAPDKRFKGKLGKTAVEEGAPLVEIISDASQGEVKHERTGQVVSPTFPYEHAGMPPQEQVTDASAAAPEPRPTDVAWVDDAQDNGGQNNGQWNFVGKDKAPVFSGEKSRQQASPGLVQHYFEKADNKLTIKKGDKLYAYVYLDPKDPPRSIMLQYHANGSWDHRAYWGEDVIPFGRSKGDSGANRSLGPLPETGKWIRLEVDPARLDLEPGSIIEGMAFTQFGGQLWWDQAGIHTRSTQSDSTGDSPAAATRRQQLARWITAPENPYFARSYVNRIWSYLLGVGLIEPVDDIRAGNPPTNPELLDRLTEEFIRGGFDVRRLIADICKSRTYQVSVKTNRWNEDDTLNYTHATPRRLSAEILYDVVHRVTGSQSDLPGLPKGARAAEIFNPDAKLADGFLDMFGRPPRESACECERSSSVLLGPVMNLVNGPTIGNAISDPNNAIARLVEQQPDNTKLIEELFLRILNRPPTPREIQSSSAIMDSSIFQKEIEEARNAWEAHREKIDANFAAWRTQQETLLQNRPALSTWNSLGPFKGNSHDEVFGKSFIPETEPIDLEKTHENLSWKVQPEFKDGQINSLQGDNSATYVYRIISSPDQRKVTLYFGSDDGVRVWLNGAEILSSNVLRGAGADQEKVAVQLKLGENTLLMKISNGGGQYAFFFRIAGEGQAVSLPPKLVAILLKPDKDRSPEENTQLLEYYRSQDAEYVKLKETFERAASATQNPRLIGAQDLAWALINSPAFLFNH